MCASSNLIDLLVSGDRHQPGRGHGFRETGMETVLDLGDFYLANARSAVVLIGKS